MNPITTHTPHCETSPSKPFACNTTIHCAHGLPTEWKANTYFFFPVRFSIIVCCTMFCFFHLSIRFYDDVEFCLWYDTWRRECENREKPGEEMVQFCRWYCFSYCQLLVRCGCDCDCVYMYGSVCDTPNVYTPSMVNLSIEYMAASRCCCYCCCCSILMCSLSIW